MPEKPSFKVRIHDFDHPPPHCHIYCSGGQTFRITLPLLIEMDGKKFGREIKDYLESHLDELATEWEEKNPKLH